MRVETGNAMIGRVARNKAHSYLLQVTPLGLLRRIDRPGERRAAGMVLLSTGMAILVIWVIAGAALYQTRTTTILEQKADLERSARIVEEQTRNELTKIQLFLSFADSYYQQHKGLDPLHDPEFPLFVRKLSSITKSPVDIYLVTTKGDIYSASGEETVPLTNVADRDYVLAQQDPDTRGLFIGRPMKSRIDQHWVLPISYPLSGSPGDILLLSANIDSLTLEQHYEASRPRPNGSVLLVHRDGTVLVRAPSYQTAVGTSLTKGAIWTEGLKTALQGSLEIDKSAIDGISRVAAFNALQDFPLVVIVAAPIEDILAHWKKFMGVVLKIGALLTAVVLLLAHHLILRIRELSTTRDELEQMAQTDPLTGLFNRRHFWLLGRQEISRITRYDRPLSIVTIDLDHFKKINDHFGHAAGDDALRWFATALRASLRQSDVPARLGGEEFAVLLPETTTDNAGLLAERIRIALAATPVSSGGQTFPLTASFGVAGTDNSQTTLETLLARADLALYQAKNGGRNRTIVAADEPVDEVQHAR